MGAMNPAVVLAVLVQILKNTGGTGRVAGYTPRCRC